MNNNEDIYLYITPLINNINNNNNNNDNNDIVQLERLKLVEKIESLLLDHVTMNQSQYNLVLSQTMISRYCYLDHSTSPSTIDDKEKRLVTKKLKMLFFRKLNSLVGGSNDKRVDDDDRNHLSLYIKFIKQVLLDTCENESKEISKVLDRYIFSSDAARWFQNFFYKHPNRIKLYFQHFHYDGKNLHGALALERFIFCERDNVWDLLKWSGARPVTPIIAAQHREQLLNLDVVATINNFIDYQDREPKIGIFWRDYIYKRIIKDGGGDGSFLSIDYNHFVNLLYDLLLDTNRVEREGQGESSLLETINDILDHLFDHIGFSSMTLSLLNQDEIIEFIKDTSMDLKIQPKPQPQSSFNQLLLFNSLIQNNINILINNLFNNDEYLDTKLKIESTLNEFIQTTTISTIKQQDNNQQQNSNNNRLIESFIYYFTMKRWLNINNIDDYLNFNHIQFKKLDNNNHHNNSNNDDEKEEEEEEGTKNIDNTIWSVNQSNGKPIELTLKDFPFYLYSKLNSK
ncbi:hypothetical protein DFA_08717 [Cavenderia fasciculata]|uniref:Uncharacterized protein n=1 Tax=Cavenderia fasciculata TaxID=261658 RepID=F4Q3W3_CACFS|nr:uncharacterized protein DFA_08717 [Cavenderia fasciculata]EGG17719.1 hypothetical protein DFA_08717 [Cavenderia fasciculata]|eukprot:XP_004356203.1 hypothetical protein DFA_08717 [Cavenderia fasciculata]